MALFTGQSFLKRTRPDEISPRDN